MFELIGGAISVLSSMSQGGSGAQTAIPATSGISGATSFASGDLVVNPSGSTMLYVILGCAGLLGLVYLTRKK